MIGRAPGVGPKLALRIATELKDKAPSMMLRADEEGAAVAIAHAPRGPESDAVSALVHLGYSDVRAAEAVARAAQALGEHTEAGALIREALKGMAR
jgi:Holliday junction DNA helicase RuvA